LSEKIGWVQFFLLTSVVGLPAILLIFWVGPRDDLSNSRRQRALQNSDARSEDPTPA
jgi:hypothetical protein